MTPSELFHRVFPEYLAMGMTAKEFWEEDCTLVIPYREAYRIRQQEMNRAAWLQGLYVYRALQSTPVIVYGFAKKDAKPEPYPSKPLEFTRKSGQERKDEEARLRADRIRRNMLMFIAQQQADKKQINQITAKEMKGGDGNYGWNGAADRGTG